MSRNQIIFVFDSVMLMALCAVESLRVAGIAFHEWLGISLIAVFLVHLLLSWNWIASETKQHFVLRAGRNRTSYLLNFVLFALTVITIFTGIAISEAALPALRIAVEPNPFWRRLHSLGADLMVLLAGLHIALNWDWIFKTLRQLFHKKTPTAVGRLW